MNLTERIATLRRAVLKLETAIDATLDPIFSLALEQQLYQVQLALGILEDQAEMEEAGHFDSELVEFEPEDCGLSLED